MAKHLTLLTGLLPAIVLGGCGAPGAYRGLESEHQPVVTRSEYALDLRTAPQGLAPGEADRLAGWMASLNLGYGDAVRIAPGETTNAVRADIAEAAARFGLKLASGATPAATVQGPVRVIVARSHAVVPGCPATTSLDQPNFDSHTSVNFGCAINSNLAAMIARPEDLVQGRSGDGLADPDSAIKAIDSWRKQPPSGEGGLPSVSTRSGGGSSQ
ncbi:CpaD family pilus assembly protein [Stakelama pacifica]|uniref:Pilus assembly protein CpaD n=1 Tax=Stakelama pacifica TaxID=517720 RepID=A0A4R6FPW9_9SPHN|nr:CpaD family pilus assembly lipoprotein [Stakelama pacifica]TDN83731.1 pilus assembly protein CpaD [Stakelama pacifica]GGO94660.1 type IV pilus protein [Stakelama pacifica]